VAAVVPYLDVQGNRFSKLRSVIKLNLYYTDLPWIVTKYRPNCSVFVFQITGLVSQWTESRGRGCTAPWHSVEVPDSDLRLRIFVGFHSPSRHVWRTCILL